MENMIFRTSEVAQGGANVAVVNSDGAMVGDSISKHRRSGTSLKGRRKYFGLACSLLLALCVGFSSCGDDDDNGDNDDNGGNGDNGGGKNGILTIKGIPAEYNDLYIYVSGSKTPDDVYYIDFAGFEKEVGYVTHFVKISGGEAKIPMWGLNRSNLNYSPYTGNDKDIQIEVEIFNVSSYDWGIMTDRLSEEYLSVRIRERLISGVDFTNGDATVEWGDEPDFVGVWAGDPMLYDTMSLRITFDEDGTWSISNSGGLAYSGTYTSNGKTATMIITQVHSYGLSEYEGSTGTGTIVGNKLTVSGFDGVTFYSGGFLNGEYSYNEN